MAVKAKKMEYPLRWVVESIEEERSYLEKPMFGCLAIYLHGRLSLLLSSGDEPWNGLLIPTDHQFHESIKKDFNVRGQRLRFFLCFTHCVFLQVAALLLRVSQAFTVSGSQRINEPSLMSGAGNFHLLRLR